MEDWPMTLQTILIADDPQRFRFRVGDRVAVRDPEGYADLGHSGIVTDGTLTENTPTGAYQTVYRVRGADGQTFAAREVDLLRVFNEASLREEIRARLQTYHLPHRVPQEPEGDLQGREVMREARRGQRCSACDHLIAPSDPSPIEYEYPDRGVVRFHTVCHAIWLEERKQR